MKYTGKVSQDIENMDPAEVSKQAKKKAMQLLEKQDRTEKQLFDKLTEKGFPEEAVLEALTYVKSFHYVDDERYARNYISYRQNVKSRNQLKMELLRKGVDKEIIEAVLMEEYEEDERKMIMDLLQKKKFHPETSDVKERNRIMGFLLRRGFSVEDVKHCMKNYEAEDEVF